MKKSNNAKKLFFTAITAIAMIGLYNAVVINSESTLSSQDTKYVKRLDEALGVVTPGRSVAGWKKLEKAQLEELTPATPVVIVETKTPTPSTESPNFEPVIKENLELSLVEVVNPIKWQNGLTSTQFSGALNTNEGMIESLNVALPDSEDVFVSFAELAGNVFNYELAGEIYSGMLYQVDQHSYMITLTNGPLEGTRLRFSNLTTQEQQFQTEQALADAQIETGSFGQEAVPYASMDDGTETQEIQAQVFNFNSQSL